MLGVGALSTVLAVTSGFQAAFREKVLGVNAHLIIRKSSMDFTEYRDAIARIRSTPGVIGAAPFVLSPMMITRGDRIAGVLVKGVDPDLLGQVLDLPSYLLPGSSIRVLRRPGATPPPVAEESVSAPTDRSLDDYLARSRDQVRTSSPPLRREPDRAAPVPLPTGATPPADQPGAAR